MRHGNRVSGTIHQVWTEGAILSKTAEYDEEAFADEIGKSWSFVAKIESPTRAFGVSMETLFKIAEVLQVPVSKLFED